PEYPLVPREQILIELLRLSPFAGEPQVATDAVGYGQGVLVVLLERDPGDAERTFVEPAGALRVAGRARRGGQAARGHDGQFMVEAELLGPQAIGRLGQVPAARVVTGHVKVAHLVQNDGTDRRVVAVERLRSLDVWTDLRVPPPGGRVVGWIARV